MRPDLDPTQLTPDERFREVAAILADGLLRLRDRAALAANPETSPPPEGSAELSPKPLAIPSGTSVTVTGVDGPRDPETTERRAS